LSQKKVELIFSKYDRGSGACNGQNEGGEKDTVFVLEDGATLRNVIIGKDQSEGVYCLGYNIVSLSTITKAMLTFSQYVISPLTETTLDQSEQFNFPQHD
jgi:hypothetical protein